MPRRHVLLAAAAVLPVAAGLMAAVLVFSGSSERAGETDTVMPGEVVEFADGLIVSVPASASQPLTVEVSWNDFEADPLFPADDEALEGVDRFVEVRTLDAHSWVEAPPGESFLLGIPVPDDFDDARLVSVEYAYQEFIGHGASTDHWESTSGVFDPVERLYVLSLPVVGGEDYPTRAGIIEHRDYETWRIEAIVDSLTGQGTAERASNISSTEARTEAPSSGARHLISDHHKDGAEFLVVCKLADCDSEEAHELASAIEEALIEALPVYREMRHSQDPALRTTFGSDPPVYKYYLREGGVGINRCGGDWNGYYLAVLGTGVTCTNAASRDLTGVRATTAHELFHAMQFAITLAIPDGFIIEGSARLAQTYDRPLELPRRSTIVEHGRLVDAGLADERPLLMTGWDQLPPVDEYLGSGRPYRGAYFFYFLFESAGLDFSMMGDLFNTGLRLGHLDTFVREHTPYEDLGDAYWAWSKDQAFEAQYFSSRMYLSGRLRNEFIPCLPQAGAAEAVPHVLPAGQDTMVISAPADLHGFESRVFELRFPPSETGDYEVTVTVESDSERDIRWKFYESHQARTDACWDTPENSALTAQVQDEEEVRYLLLSRAEWGTVEPELTVRESIGDGSILPEPGVYPTNQGDEVSLSVESGVEDFRWWVIDGRIGPSAPVVTIEMFGHRTVQAVFGTAPVARADSPSASPEPGVETSDDQPADDGVDEHLDGEAWPETMMLDIDVEFEREVSGNPTSGPEYRYVMQDRLSVTAPLARMGLPFSEDDSDPHVLYAPLEHPVFEHEHLGHQVLTGDCGIDAVGQPEIEIRPVLDVQSGEMHFWLGTGRHADSGQYTRTCEDPHSSGVMPHEAERALRSVFTRELGVAPAGTRVGVFQQTLESTGDDPDESAIIGAGFAMGETWTATFSETRSGTVDTTDWTVTLTLALRPASSDGSSQE